MKRLFFFFTALVVLIVVAAAAMPFLLSADFVGKQLVELVKANTGRTLKINGSLRFKFWPDVMVEANDVTLSNPPEMYKGQFAAIKTLRVKVAAMPLLSREVIIKEIFLLEPRLNLVVDGKGRSNWEFSGGKKAGAAPAKPGDNANIQDTIGIKKISLHPIHIRDGNLVFLDERAGSTFSAKRVNFVVTLKQINGPVDVKGSLFWRGHKIELATYAKAPGQLAGTGSALDLSIVADLLNVQFSGRAKLDRGLALAGRVSVKTPAIRKLAKWVGTPLSPGKGLKTFSAKAGLDLSGQTIKLSKARVKLDGMNAQGNLVIALGGPRPKITGNIGMDKIDVNAYLNKPKKGEKAAPKSKGWSREKIDFSGLKAVDAKLSIATSLILYQDVKIGTSHLNIDLKNGRLNAQLKKMSFYKGKATGQIILSSVGKRATIQGALNARGLDALTLLRDFADFRRLEGRSQIQLSLATTGSSQYQMVSTLTGQAKFKFNNGAIRGINVAAMVRNVQKSVLSGWGKKGGRQKTDFSELSATFKIKNGVAITNDLKMLAPLVRLTGKGNADMLREKLDFRIEPKLVATLKGQGGIGKFRGLAVPILIKGPWSDPKIYPDIKGILTNPQAAFKKLSALSKQLAGKDLQKIKSATVKNLKTGAGKKLKVIEKKVGKKIIKKVSKTVGKKVSKTTKKSVQKKGQKVLKNLFGSKKKK